MKFKQRVLMLFALLCLNSPSCSIELQDIDVVEHTAYVYALEQAQAQYDNPQVVMGSLDSRL